MIGLRRWILHVCVVISLLLCVTSIVLWVRGHRVFERFQFSGTARGGKWRCYSIDSVLGEIYLHVQHWQFQDDASAAWYAKRYPTPQGFYRGKRDLATIDTIWRFHDTWWNRRRFVFYSSPMSRQHPGLGQSFTASPYSFGIPCWFAMTTTAIAPSAAIFRALRRKKKIREGQCPVCGYDLRATPDRCPECGTVPTKTAVPSR
jgi:hypothetical protein